MVIHLLMISICWQPYPGCIWCIFWSSKHGARVLQNCSPSKRSSKQTTRSRRFRDRNEDPNEAILVRLIIVWLLKKNFAGSARCCPPVVGIMAFVRKFYLEPVRMLQFSVVRFHPQVRRNFLPYFCSTVTTTQCGLRICARNVEIDTEYWTHPLSMWRVNLR